ncbi:hypothetical protein GC722_10250 [Auraticoccus sp. F435]|uniref:ESX-1 secretion-associated protein n=1 Tax=Auraticoccus cholistanensis TaxID=2656650 RepID=A0A6A9UUP2_9ACTN|nr:hypothetical protein [Auraticoccus cholistanensis]MVA76401.1 hypothetical protein [Auraticoccus cholistanensis]
MADFTVDRAQLDAGADAFEGLHGQAEETAQALADVPLVESDFGRIPWLQTRVWEAFVEHRDACQESLTELTDALDSVRAGLSATSATYRIMDEDAEQAAELLIQGMGGGPA